MIRLGATDLGGDAALRDLFAGMAMQGAFANDYTSHPAYDEQGTSRYAGYANAGDLAKASYAIADAMIKARNIAVLADAEVA